MMGGYLRGLATIITSLESMKHDVVRHNNTRTKKRSDGLALDFMEKIYIIISNIKRALSPNRCFTPAGKRYLFHQSRATTHNDHDDLPSTIGTIQNNKASPIPSSIY